LIFKVLTNIQTAKLLDLGSIKVTYLDDLQSLCEALFILLNGCPLEIIVAFPEVIEISKFLFFSKFI